MRDPSPFAWPRSDADGTPLGIDLAKRAGEVRKLVIAGMKAPPGVELDDLVQDVLFAIHRKNHQASAYDPRRASFGHYVHRVAICTLINSLPACRRAPEPVGLDLVEVADDVPSAYDRLEALDVPDVPQPWELAIAQRRAEAEAETAAEKRAAEKREASTPWQITLFSADELAARRGRTAVSARHAVACAN